MVEHLWFGADCKTTIDHSSRLRQIWIWYSLDVTLFTGCVTFREKDDILKRFSWTKEIYSENVMLWILGRNGCLISSLCLKNKESIFIKKNKCFYRQSVRWMKKKRNLCGVRHAGNVTPTPGASCWKRCSGMHHRCKGNAKFWVDACWPDAFVSTIPVSSNWLSA